MFPPPPQHSSMNDRTLVRERPQDSRVKQGLLGEGELKRPIIPVCEGWPSWLYAMINTQWEIHQLFYDNLEEPWLSLLQDSYPRVSFRPWSEFSSEVHTKQTYFLFVQSSLSWWVRHQRIRTAFPRILHVCPHQSQRNSLHPANTLQFQSTFSHLMFGGCVYGDWLVSTNFRFEVPHSIHSYPRRLRHCVNPTTKTQWRVSSPPCQDHLEFDTPHSISDDSLVLDWNGPLPFQFPLSRIRCHSVFSSTKWVQRSLSSTELGRCFDLPGFMQDWFRCTQQAGLPFLAAAPAKLLNSLSLSLHEGGYEVYDHIISEQEEPECKADTNLGQDSLWKDIKLEQAGRQLSYQMKEDWSKAGSQLSFQKEEDWSKAFAQAVKADDAEIPTHLWDNKIWGLDHKRGTQGHVPSTVPTMPLGVAPAFLLTALASKCDKELSKISQRRIRTCVDNSSYRCPWCRGWQRMHLEDNSS